MRRAAAIDAVTGVYAFALAASSVMLTFIAIGEGLSLTTIAMLSATSAATQFGSRAAITGLYRIVSDRTIMAGALGLLVLSMIAVLVFPGIAGLLLAQALQGVSRAGFWSGSQVHVLRSARNPARRMAINQFFSGGLGALGPVMAGLAAERDQRSAIILVAIVSSVGAAGCVLLTRHPVFERVTKSAENGVWQQRGVRIGSFGSLAAGAFNSVLVTFVPVLFDGIGWSEAAVGTLVSVVNAGLLVGSLVAGAVRPSLFALTVTAATLVIATGTGALALTDVASPVAVAGAIAAGVASGVILTLAPTLVSRSAPEPLRGSAVVFAGIFRAGALFGTPIIVAGTSLILPLAVAMLVVGAASGIPGAIAAGRSRNE